MMLKVEKVENGYFHLFQASDSKRARVQARVIGNSLTGVSYLPEEDFQVFAKNQTAANALRAPLFSLLLTEEKPAC
jgi:hypothetical protein